ncbi:protein xmas [Sabethes cyaneus]|uniref:protein xmas n=1 Tax=Sabethes cyaneus TaxID=53552 RepID=UPI00237E41EE|nr:protein xmas [Sabethes cyaneus]
MSDDDVILIEDSPQRKSISCEQIPELWVLDKLIAKKHFSQFGKITGFILRPKRFSCTVEYDSQEAAEAALARGGQFRDVKFSVFWTDEAPAAQNAAAASARDEGFVDPEVQQELDSMVGGPTAMRAKHATKLSIESFLKKTERFPTPPVVAPPKPFRILPSRMDGAVDSKVAQARAEFELLAKQSSSTAEERYRVLEARDKYIRLTSDRTTDIRKASSTQGTCGDMCPEKERYMRECKFQVASYEAGDSSQQIDHQKAIKQYSRSSADQEAPMPHELRSESGLERTMNYLLHRIVDDCDDEEVNLADWFHFVWDRTRSLRKDITQQELCSAKAVRLVEQCARFHIHCAARLVAEEPSVFDQKINTENMTKCLQSLKYMYHDLGLKGIRCPNEAEFRAYVVLLNLNDGNFLWEIKQLPADILHSNEIRFALKVYFALENNNYVKFFRLVRQTTYMNACILLRYFNQIRTRALETMLKAYTYRAPASFALDHITDLLAFEDTEAAVCFLESYGLPVDQGAGVGTVLMDPKQYERPELLYQLDRAYNLVESKRDCTVGEAISGQPLDDDFELESYQLEESFDASGFLRDEVLRNILKPAKPLATSGEAASAQNDDDKVFKVPSPTSISPKSMFSRPLAPPSGTFFQPSRFTSRIETNAPAPLAPSVFSKNSPTPAIAGITPLAKASEPLQPLPFGQNLFGTVSFAQQAIDSSRFGSAGSIFGGPTGKPLKSNQQLQQDEQAQRKRDAEEAERARRKQREEEMMHLQRQAEELRQKREAEEERLRQELIARKEEEIRQLRQLEEEGRRQLEITVNKVSEKIFAELVAEVCDEDAKQIATDCFNRYQLLERLPQQLLEELQEEFLVEFLNSTLREEAIIRNCQENRQLNMTRKYFHLWQRNVHKLLDNRQQIENSPAWLPERNLPEQARECFQEHQVLSLANMKRYLGGIPKQFSISEPKENKVDLFSIVRNGLKRNSVRQERRKGLVRNHTYWKIAISVPFKQEEDSSGFYYFINKWLKTVFQQTAESAGKYFFLDVQESTTARERLAVCVRLLKGASSLDELNTPDATAIDNSNGLLFFLTSNNIAKSKTRLHNTLRNATVWGPVPLTIIAYNFQPNLTEPLETALDLETLLEEGKIDDYEIHHHRETEKMPLRGALQKSLAFLASGYGSDCPLEMQSQTAFIGTCLGDEQWHRFRLSADQNPKLQEACQDLNFVIGLFNQAIDRTTNLVRHDFTAYSDFPAEFKPLVSKRRFDIPLDLEYFPKDWRDPARQRKLQDFFTQLKLSPAEFDPTSCNTVQELQPYLLAYIRNHLPQADDKSARRLLASLLQELLKTFPSVVDLSQTIHAYNWLPIVSILAGELLRLHWSNSIMQLPCEVIYHRGEFESYTGTLWWLTELRKLPTKRKSLPEATNGQQEAAPQSDEEDCLDAAAALATSTSTEPLPAKKMKLNISLAKDDLEEILSRGQRCLQRVEEQLTEVRKRAVESRELASILDGRLYDQERSFRANKWTWESNFR